MLSANKFSYILIPENSGITISRHEYAVNLLKNHFKSLFYNCHVYYLKKNLLQLWLFHLISLNTIDTKNSNARQTNEPY